MRALGQKAEAMTIPDNAIYILVCMRLAEMSVVHPDQSWELCSMCQHTVGVYPSGQKAMKHWPNMKIVCSRCASPDDFDISIPAAETREEFLAEKRDSKPVAKQ
jgi:hypothetical protein